MFPANSHVIRLSEPADAIALRRLAALEGRPPLSGRIYVAEVAGTVAAAMSRDEWRTLADRSVAPPYLTTLLRLRVVGLDAAAREPDVSERMREAVLEPRAAAEPPMAA